MRMSDPVSAKEDSVATRGPAETEPSSSSSSPGVNPLRRDNGVSDTTSSSSPSSSSPCPEQTNNGKGDVCCHNKEIQPPAGPAKRPKDRLNLQISRSFDKEELSARDDDEKEKSCEKQEKPSRQPLSRDSSQDYTDSTGIDLHEFLVNTLKNNPRDRIMLLKLEQEILDFISNNEILKRKFPPMTSYHRMLLHRVAAYFGMEHNVDPTGKSVVINKTSSTRIPDEKFSEHIKDGRTDEFQRRYILKRDNSSFDREDCMIRMRLKDDRRSKSIEEREEEYQRARDRIFAQDGDHFYLDRRIHDEDGHMSTQQRRQIFRLRDSQSGTSRQSSSDNEPRYGEPRPWSSTDSSDSSHRNPLPAPPAAAAITKASSFSSISLLVRGDSTPSSKSTGPLSKTGSESSGSVGSSTSSLSRPQLPLLPAPPPPAPAPPVPPLAQALPVAAAPTPGSSATVPGSCGRFERSRTGPALAPSGTSYYLVPLETAGIPAGSVLVNPHTGQPFVNPDGSPVVYNPTSTSSSGCPQQHPPPPPSAPQHTANHMLSQPVRPLQSSAQPLHYPTISYPPPPAPPPAPAQFLPVSPSQQYTVQENLSGQFSHMTLVRQASGDAPVQNNHAAMFPSSTMVLQCPQQHAGYMVGPPGQPPPGPGYPSSGPGPGPPAMSQQVLQQQTYIQQQPVQQMASCYCGPAQYQPQSSQQHYRPVTPLHYTTSPQGQQPGYSAMLPNPVAPQSYQSVLNLQQAALPLPQHPHAPPPPPNPNLLGNPQHGAMGNQMQSMMVQYPSMASYQQVSVPPMSHSLAPQHQPQPQPQQGYQQPLVFSTPPSQTGLPMGGMQVYYSILPQNQHSMSSTVCFLPPPGSEHMQFPRAASPCGPQPLSGQQQHCSGVHPTPTPPPPGGGGMVMMQLTLPSNQQQPRPHSPIQWKQHKYYSVEHHHYQQPQQQQQQYQQQHSQHLSHRALEHETHRQSSGASLASSTAPTTSALPPQALSPSPGHLGSTKGPCSSSSSMVPILAHHTHHPQFPPPPSYSHGQGEGRYSLLGQPLQFNPTLRPPLIHATHMVPHHQSSMGIRHSGRGRKPPRKSLSTDLSVGEPVSGRVLEVTNLPEGISRGQADTLLAQLSKAGANIKWLSERQSPRLLCGAGDGPRGETNAPQDLASTYTILALFPSEHAAQSALLRLSGPLASFKLRTSRRQDELGGPGKAGLQ